METRTMSDFGIYWKNYAKETSEEDWRLSRWVTNSERLGRCSAGDRLWFFTSGNKCGMAESQAGFLVALLTVSTVQDNRENDPDYPACDFHYVIRGEESRCFPVKPPLSVDNILR